MSLQEKIQQASATVVKEEMINRLAQEAISEDLEITPLCCAERVYDRICEAIAQKIANGAHGVIKGTMMQECLIGSNLEGICEGKGVSVNTTSIYKYIHGANEYGCYMEDYHEFIKIKLYSITEANFWGNKMKFVPFDSWYVFLKKIVELSKQDDISITPMLAVRYDSIVQYVPLDHVIKHSKKEDITVALEYRYHEDT